VFVDDPEQFLAGCLADETRKQQILETVGQGKYTGFHHKTGRYLCVRCEHDSGSETSFSYHYPWELAALEDFTPFDLERDMREVLKKLIAAGMKQSAALNALCAEHALQLAHLLYPQVAARLRILEVEISRPRP
jgi:hypothetical protein